jgi:hypothetical protein
MYMKFTALVALAMTTAGFTACQRNPSPTGSQDVAFAPADTSPPTAIAALPEAALQDNILAVYCTGTSCGAIDPSTYSGTGTGIWGYNNTTASPANVDVNITGVHAGNVAVVVFSNGQPTSTTPPQIPKSLQHRAVAHAILAKASPTSIRAATRDRAHGKLLEKNRERAIALIAGRVAVDTNHVLLTPPPPAEPAPAPTLGTTRSWYDNFSTPPRKYGAAVRHTCKLPTSRNAVLWTDTSGAAVDVQPFAQVFCGDAGGYARVTKLLGDVWGIGTEANTGTLISDLPSLQDVNIVFLNVPPGTGWGGYFDATNNFLADDGDLKTSNQALVFFINAPDISSGQNYYLSTLLHELTHMVNFYQRAVSRGFTHDTWLEETSAMMTEDIVVPAVVSGGYSNITDDRVRPYLATGGDVSLVNWPQLSGPHYSMGGSFGAFLDRRYGVRLYKGLVSCDASRTPPSYGCLDKLIQSFGGRDFGDESARFAATIFAVFPPAGITAFGYPQVENETYMMEPIDVSKFADQRPDAAAPIGDNFPATSHTYSVATIGAGVTTLVAKGIVVPPHSAMLLVIR